MKCSLLPVLALLVAGCANIQTVSELRGDASSATFIQVGSEPWNYTFGVVDTSSFWAAYGDGVSDQLGGDTLWTGLATDGRKQATSKADEHAAILRELYDHHPLVDRIGAGIMPQLASLWDISYRPGVLRTVERDAVQFDDNRNLVNSDADTDLVFLYNVGAVTLTERFSMGGALASGLTMGTNTKNVTTTATVRLQAFKRDPASGNYNNIWSMGCGTNYVQMKTAYPFPEAIKSKEKIAEMLDEATALSIEGCNKTLNTLSQQAKK